MTPRPMARAVIWCVLGLPWLHGATAETYHVDGAKGSDDNDGCAAPFRTIARAVKALDTGDRLVIARTEAPYRESLVLNVGGTAQQPLVVEGSGAVLRLSWTDDYGSGVQVVDLGEGQHAVGLADVPGAAVTVTADQGAVRVCGLRSG